MTKRKPIKIIIWRPLFVRVLIMNVLIKLDTGAAAAQPRFPHFSQWPLMVLQLLKKSPPPPLCGLKKRVFKTFCKPKKVIFLFLETLLCIFSRPHDMEGKLGNYSRKLLGLFFWGLMCQASDFHSRFSIQHPVYIKHS